MYTNIWNALKDILDTLKGTTKINEVYNYDKTVHEKLPAVTISPVDSIETLYSTIQNALTLKYRIRVVDDSKDIENMEIRMRGIADAILRELRLNESLNDTVCKFDTDVNWGWSGDEQPYRTFDVILTCIVYPSFV